MAETVNPDQLAQAFGEILQTFNHDVTTLTDVIAQEVARDGVMMLKSFSPARRGGGKYASSWDTKQTKKGTVYIYNKKHYRLTHLLEKGHKTVLRQGLYGKKARTAAIPHISTVEAKVQEEFPNRVARAIQYQR